MHINFRRTEVTKYKIRIINIVMSKIVKENQKSVQKLGGHITQKPVWFDDNMI